MNTEENDGLAEHSHQSSPSNDSCELLLGHARRRRVLNKPVGLLLDQVEIRRERSREGNIRFGFFKGDFRIKRRESWKEKKGIPAQPLCSKYCRDCNQYRLQKDGLNPFCSACKIMVKKHIKMLLFAKNVAKKLVKHDSGQGLQNYTKIQESLSKHLIEIIPSDQALLNNRLKQSFHFAVQELILLFQADHDKADQALSQLINSIGQPATLYLFFKINAESDDWDKIKSFSFVLKHISGPTQVCKQLEVLQRSPQERTVQVVGEILKRSIQSRWPIFQLNQ